MTTNHGAIGFGRARVLHLIPYLARGGAELQLCQLAEDQADDASVTVACLDVTTDLQERLGRAGVIILDARDGRRAFLRRLLAAARQAEVVHAWMYHGFLMSAALRPFGRGPHIWSVRRTDPASAGLRRRTRGVIWLTKSLSRRVADGIIYCSTAAEDAHRAAGFGSRSHTVIYNSVRIPAQAIETADNTRAGRIGFLGRWNADKGLDVLFAGWQIVTRHLQGVELVIAGPGLTADAVELSQAIESVGLDPRPILLGPIDDPDSFLRTLDCLVSPSRTEGFPNVVAEAMAAALPVIATRVGGTPEVLADCGELVEPDDPESLADAIISFVQDPRELRIRARRGRVRAVSEFSRERALRSTNDFYDVVIESRLRRRRRGQANS